jgi:hypothetical protein
VRKLGWPVLFVALTAFYWRVFSLFAHSADTASGFLRSLDFASGNWTLSGWVLAVNHYLTSDVLLSALLSMFVGDNPLIMDLLPAIWWAAVVVTSLRLSSLGLNPAERRTALACVALFLGFPLLWGTSAIGVPVESYIHMGTMLYTLWGYALVNEYVAGGSASALGPFAFLVVFSGIGDPMVYTLGWLPILVTCAVLHYLLPNSRYRNIGLVTLAGIIAAIVCTKWLAHLGLRPQKMHTAFTEYENWRVNLALFPGFLLRYAGGFCFGLDLRKENLLELLLHLSRIPLLFVLIGWVVRGAARLLLQVDGRARGHARPLAAPPFFDSLLLCAVLVNCAAVLTSQQVSDWGSLRYLLPGYLYGAILLARHIHSVPLVLPLIPVSLVLSLLFYCKNVLPHLTREAVTAPSSIHWTAGKVAELGLAEGYAEFWEAHVLTVLARGEVKCRALVGNKDNEIHPYWYQSKFTWFFQDAWKGERFFVLTCELPERASLRQEAVFHTFGPPLESHEVQEFRLHIYPMDHPKREQFEREAREALAKH